MVTDDTKLSALERALNPELFKALCDPSRLTLLSRLATCGDSLSVSEASTCCGVHISGASRHLAQLERAGIVVVKREGREARYRLDAGSLVGALRSLADAIEACGQDPGCCVSNTNEKEST